MRVRLKQAGEFNKDQTAQRKRECGVNLILCLS